MEQRILVVNGHPDPAAERLCHALADAYAAGARDAGHAVRRINVARLDFPVLRSQAEFEGGAACPDIAAAQEAIGWAGHILLVYPLWLGTMPALLKEFLEQTFRPGFAFAAGGNGWPRKRLAGRAARVVVTMGMPAPVYRWFYLAHSLRSLERNILKFAGIKPVGETIFGLVGAASDAKRGKWLDRMRDLGRSGR